MVKSSEDRKEKYNAKFDAEVVRARFAATSDLAKAKQAIMQEKLQDKNAHVRTILNGHGIMPIQTVQYQAFGNKLFGICNKFAGLATAPVESPTAISVATLEMKKWLGYGSLISPLQDIWELYHTCIGTAPCPVYP